MTKASFGDHVLDLERRELLKRGATLPLSGKAFQLLELLVDAAPRAVSKQEIYARLWADVVVEEANISNLVSELRAALEDDAKSPKLIRTKHRFGYRFEGDVKWEGERATSVSGGGFTAWVVHMYRNVMLVPGENVIGRDSTARVFVDSRGASRRHARIMMGADHCTLEDLGSKNGTFLQGEKLAAPARLSTGDVIRIGSVILTYGEASASESTMTEM